MKVEHKTQRVYVAGSCSWDSGEKITCSCGWESRVFTVTDSFQLTNLSKAERDHATFAARAA